MLEVIKTDVFDDWLSGLRDRRAKARINARIRNISLGNFGDVEPVGDGVSESRIFYGPGYRVYFIQQGEIIVVLLNGGDKKSQKRDIKQAKQLAKEWRDRNG
jgi:putative addiction module killer protein